jgi:anti-sigma regulatory factor (Ser/Thr protein kinase)
MPRAPKLTLGQAMTWATQNVSAHSKDFSRAFAERFGLSRAGAAPFVRKLEDQKIIQRAGSATRPYFMPGTSKYLHYTYGLPGVDEALVWERDIQPYLQLKRNVSSILQMGVTEMLNNANDHSGGTAVTVTVDCGLRGLFATVSDDGIGVFRKVATALQLEDNWHAIVELAKGKFTTAPTHHSGEGIFFTSRAMNTFNLNANGLHYQRINGKSDESGGDAVYGVANDAHDGTRVTMVLRTDSTLELRDIYDRYTTDAPDDMTFSRTDIPVHLARLGTEILISRSQAKRVLARVDQFRNVQLDFAEVPEIGQAFADEIFRVFALAHPEIVLEAINANPDVQRMIKRAQQTKVQGV